MTEAPRDWSSEDVAAEEAHEHPADVTSRGAVLKAWMPWAILSRLRLHLGRAAGQGLPRLDLEREASRSPACTRW